MSGQEQIRAYKTASGLRRYSVEVRHDGLNKYRLIRGDSEYVVKQKARAQMAQWDEMWAKKAAREEKARTIEKSKQRTEERTKEAQEALAVLDNILAYTLGVDDAVDWESLRDSSKYKGVVLKEPISPQISREPQRLDAMYTLKIGLLDLIFRSRRQVKEQEAEDRFRRDHQKWQERKDKMLAEYDTQKREHHDALKTQEREQEEFLKVQAESNAAIDAQKADYLKGDDPQAILDYCDLVLSNSKYPDYFPQSYDLEYTAENRVLVVDYECPSVDQVPTVKEVKFAQSRGEFTEKHIPQGQLNTLFDNLLYQIALRTIHELYEADKIGALSSIVFNGYIHTIDRSTGQEVHPCVLSVQANREEFETINLANVDPKACFKSLKGIGSAKLHTLTPVAPIIRIEREDARFIEAYGVVDEIEEGDNLAAMDWEDFEHLIRELFEKEFASSGGEVKVTRASRDGGVDAVAFDPDPIRGGKIVIQAKRYTGTVGVSAVRDLYGTVVNEGANKGIIVTTSQYGPDAYDFAKGKPLTLIDGNNLLHLLEKHGHKARIDLREAKRILSEK